MYHVDFQEFQKLVKVGDVAAPFEDAVIHLANVLDRCHCTGVEASADVMEMLVPLGACKFTSCVLQAVFIAIVSINTSSHYRGMSAAANTISSRLCMQWPSKVDRPQFFGGISSHEVRHHFALLRIQCNVSVALFTPHRLMQTAPPTPTTRMMRCLLRMKERTA